MELRTKYKGIMVGIFQNGDKGNIIIAPGFPQYIDKNHPFIKTLSDLGYNIFTPRYAGSWESDGVFSIKNCTDSLRLTVELVKKGMTIELYTENEITWSAKKTYLIGFSFGALPTLLLGDMGVDTILLCPFIDIHYHGVDSTGENLYHSLKFIQRAYTNLYRMNIGQITKELEEIIYPEMSNFILAIGDEDTTIPKEEILFLESKYKLSRYILSGGHSLNVSRDDIVKLLSYSNTISENIH